MPTKSTTNITRTEVSVDDLRFAHNRITIIEGIVNEDEWGEMMLDYGLRYAHLFAKMYGDQANKIEKYLTHSPAEKGQLNNWFWLWWRFKWMQDDWDYITNKVQRLPDMSYQQYKCYLLNCETLEEDLLNLLTSKQIL